MLTPTESIKIIEDGAIKYARKTLVVWIKHFCPLVVDSTFTWSEEFDPNKGFVTLLAITTKTYCYKIEFTEINELGEYELNYKKDILGLRKGIFPLIPSFSTVIEGNERYQYVGSIIAKCINYELEIS